MINLNSKSTCSVGSGGFFVAGMLQLGRAAPLNRRGDFTATAVADTNFVRVWSRPTAHLLKKSLQGLPCRVIYG